MIIALLTAAGTGSRMRQDVPKQFLHILNKPIIVHTMERFQNNPQVDAIAIATLPTWIDFVWTYAKQFGITKLRWVVPGGATGQESIRNGLDAIAAECPPETTVMVHDGNRPMVDDDIIADSLAVFREYGSAVAVVPCTEVVFKSDNGKDSHTELPREALWRTQTPHTYTLGKLLWAHEQARTRNLTGMAAMCQLMCCLGEITHFSKGSEKNLKLTTPDDIDIFKALLANEKAAH